MLRPDSRGVPAVTEVLERICVDTTRALAASGAGLSVILASGLHGMSVASDTAAARVEELQFTFGEGPCIDAFATGRPVLVSDLADGDRPVAGVRPRGAAQGVCAVFAFPLQVGAARLGVLDVFRDRPGPLSARRAGSGLHVRRAGGGDAAGRPGRAAGHGRDGVDDVLERRAELFQAQGMVMVQLGVSLAEALARIRAHAYADEPSAERGGADIVARRLRFDTERP